jgi:hypothetical protein
MVSELSYTTTKENLDIFLPFLSDNIRQYTQDLLYKSNTAARLTFSRPTKPLLQPSRRLIVKAGERSGASQEALTMSSKVVGFARRAANG